MWVGTDQQQQNSAKFSKDVSENILSSMTKSKAKSPNHPLARLLQYGERYRTVIWQATICSILNRLFDLAPPAIIGAAVDVVVQQEDSIVARFGITDIFWH